MNTPEFGTVLADAWPGMLGASISVPIFLLFIRHRPDIADIRQVLGGTLRRYGGVSPERLDTDLILAARAAQRGWRGFASIIAYAILVSTACFASAFVRAAFPSLPHWYQYLIGAPIILLVAWSVHRMERRAILYHLEHLHNQPGSAS